MSNRKFTWANALDTPTYERLDRVLVSTDWELKFPLATVIALNREISDHTPLLLDTGEENQASSHSRFKFELSWLLTEDFFDIVAEVWKKENRGATPMQRWQNKIRRLRQFLRGWSKNINGEYKKRKRRSSQEGR